MHTRRPRRHVPRARLELRERLLCEMMVRASKKEARAEMRAMGSAWGQYVVEANRSKQKDTDLKFQKAFFFEPLIKNYSL